MDDLVKRLRNPVGTSGSDFNAIYWLGISSEAADRIEILEAALQEMISLKDKRSARYKRARAALEGKDGN